MGMMDKFLNAMQLNDSDTYEGDEEGYYDDGVAEEEEHTKQDEQYVEEKPKKISKVTPIKQNKRNNNNNGGGMKVCVIKPTSIEEGREITDTLLSNRTVVLNLEGLDMDIAQRIIDFTSGSCYAISGNMQKISHYIFIITPKSVDISGDFQEILGGGSIDVPDIQ
ncbi:MAG: cell division protein SepF [Lachnospiraceae bacterium]|nr:cell division protein SepF [Lachnospiraceae bacterium]